MGDFTVQKPLFRGQRAAISGDAQSSFLLCQRGESVNAWWPADATWWPPDARPAGGFRARAQRAADHGPPVDVVLKRRGNPPACSSVWSPAHCSCFTCVGSVSIRSSGRVATHRFRRSLHVDLCLCGAFGCRWPMPRSSC